MKYTKAIISLAITNLLFLRILVVISLIIFSGLLIRFTINSLKNEEGITDAARVVSYTNISGWKELTSALGFAVQYPPEFTTLQSHPVLKGKNEYCEFIAIEELPLPFQGNTLEINVLPYTNGSRRLFLLNNWHYGRPTIHRVREIEISGFNGLEMEMSYIPADVVDQKIELDAVIFIQNKTAFILTFLQHLPDQETWEKILKSLKIYPTLRTDTAHCQAR